jgi:cardiolipin synthase
MIRENINVIVAVIYFLVVGAVAVRIIMDTQNSQKTASYLLVIIFMPFIGMAIYLTFGVNYRKRKLYRDKQKENEQLLESVKGRIIKETYNNLVEHQELLRGKEDLVNLLVNDICSPLTNDNTCRLLINGENKFPVVLEALEQAKNHIHIEYYIYEDDVIGNQIKDVLIRKAGEGVKVRFMYDDFGSHGIRKRFVKGLKDAGIEVSPFYEIKFFFLANRYNYRDHRKIIIIDGHTAFTGGINVADKYINQPSSKLFWRDTHLQVSGEAVYMLQYLFISNWNFCCEKLDMIPEYFPPMPELPQKRLVQVVSSGPDSDRASIMLAFLTAIATAKKTLYITSPYFVPGETIINALVKAALSGVDVRLLVPGESDARFVNYASRANYSDLLSVGVRIWQYRKGFVHAKTLTADDKLSMIGTANMDYRSFDLNFEVMAVIYDMDFCLELKQTFLADLYDAEQINAEAWNSRSKFTHFVELGARLVAPVL